MCVQHELNPEELGQNLGAQGFNFSEIGMGAAKAVNKFQHVPDYDSLLAGDIILFRPVKEPEELGLLKAYNTKDFSHYIQKVQETFQQPQHSRWVHAGLYLGRDLLIEAVWPNVKVSSLSERAIKECMRVRRLRDIADEHASIRYHVCVEAMKRLGDPYDWRAIYKLFKISRKKGFDTVNGKYLELLKKAYICSEIPCHAYMYGNADRAIVNVGSARHPTPADLSASHLMEDVEMNWRKLI